MKRRTFKSWLKSWDAGELDFAEKTLGPLHEIPAQPEEDDGAWARQPVRSLRELEYTIFKRVYPAMAAILALVMIVFLLQVVEELPNFGVADTPANNNEVVKRYVEKGLEETGAVNIVAGVILDYRAFDTLGESHVLFTAASAVFILLLGVQEDTESERSRRILRGDGVLTVTARVLIPLILLFGVYIILGGHLGPGGGFSGGAVLGGGLILYSMAFGPERLERVLNLRTYRVIVSCALLFYSAAKCYSFYCGAHHLETIFTTGTPGAIFSAGLILPLNIAVGLVVGCTMYGFYSVFTRGKI